MHLGLSTLNNSIFQCLQHSNVSGGERLLPLPEDLRVRFQSSATFIEQLFTVCRKDENKDKEAENGPFFKKGAVVVTQLAGQLLPASEDLGSKQAIGIF